MTPALHARLRTTALVLGLAFAAGCGDSPEAMLASAKDYLARNDPAAATIQLKNALSKNPNSGEARFLLGRALLDSGDPVAAEVELRKASDLKFSADLVTPVLARALLAQGQLKKIDELANTQINSPEGQADFKTTLAQTLAMQGKLAEARRMLDAAIAAKGDYAPALLAQARFKVLEQDAAGAHALIDGVLAKAPKDLNALLFKADLLRGEGKLPEATAAYEKAIEVRPQAVTAHAALIMIHLRGQKLDLASKQLQALEKAAAKHPLTFYMQGLVAYGRKDLPAARAAIDNVLKMQPDNPQGLQLAGLIAFETRSDVQAQEFLRKALQRAPGLDFARRTLVMSYLRSGQPTKAVETLQPVLHGAETAATWLPLAGNAYLQSGDAKTAEDYFQRAAKANPENQQNRTALALARMRTGHVEESFADLEQIAGSDAGVSADMALISTHLQQKQFDKALKAIDNLEKKQPDNPVTHNLRGGALLGKGDLEGARKSFDKALQRNPTYLPAVAALAQLDLAAKQPEQARKRYESVLAKEPKNVQALLALAELQARTGAKPEEVASQLAKAIGAAPDEPAPRLALINLHMRTKDFKKALSVIQDALAAIPNRPELLDVAGQVFQANGDTNQALAMYGKLSGLLPTSPNPYLRMAEIHAGAKHYDAARGSLNKGLALQPDSLPTQRALIMLDIAEQKLDAALAKARDIQKRQPKIHVGYLLEGDIHVIVKAWGSAAAAYRAGLKAQPTSDMAQRLYTTLILDGKKAEAGTFADGWIKAQPQDKTFRLYIADLANKRQDFALAAAQYRALLAGDANNPVLLNNLAWSLGQMKDPKALPHAEQANKLAPNQPAIMDTLGVLLVERGETARGLELLAGAVKAAPQSHVIRLNHAKALLKAGKKTEAKQELETLAKLGDKFPAQNEVTALMKGL